MIAAEEARELGFLNRVVGEEQLEQAVEQLAAQLLQKSALTLAATKQGVNAATRSTASTSGAWSDADSLLTALHDPELPRRRAVPRRTARALIRPQRARARLGPAPQRVL